MSTSGYPEGWTYEAPDPSVGLFGGGWIHEACEEQEPEVNEVAIGSVRKDNGEVETDYRITCSCGAEAIVTDHDWDPDSPEEMAAKFGKEKGAAAGSWVIDGNTTKETAMRIIKGHEQGDPAVMDMEPSPLSGEWADGITDVEVWTQCEAQADDQEVLAAFEQGFSEGYWDTVLAAARSAIDGAICSKCGKTVKRAWERAAEGNDFWEDMSGFQSCDSPERGTHKPEKQEAACG